MKLAYPLLALSCLLAACGGEPEAEPEAAEEAAPAPAPEPADEPMVATVEILEPADGGMVMGTTVTVRLTATGVEIVPAGEIVAGTGHHHLYLDADLTPPEQPVPTVPGSIIHLGTGVSEYTFEGVTAGEHRLIAVVADGAHIPLQPWVVDTVTFVVH